MTDPTMEHVRSRYFALLIVFIGLPVIVVAYLLWAWDPEVMVGYVIGLTLAVTLLPDLRKNLWKIAAYDTTTPALPEPEQDRWAPCGVVFQGSPCILSGTHNYHVNATGDALRNRGTEDPPRCTETVTGRFGNFVHGTHACVRQGPHRTHVSATGVSWRTKANQ